MQLNFFVLIFFASISLVGCSGGSSGSSGGSSDTEEDSIILGSSVSYSFDEETGAIAYNSEFDELHGYITASQRSEGKVNNALYFGDNFPSYVDFDLRNGDRDIELNFPTNELSFSLWINFTYLDHEEEYSLFGTGKSSFSRLRLDLIDSQFRFLFNPEINGTASLEVVRSDFTFGVDTWYHIALTYNGEVAKVYVNGEINAQSNLVSNIYPYSNFMMLGGGPEVQSFPGHIDEFRFSAELNSEQEVRDYYDLTK